RVAIGNQAIKVKHSLAPYRIPFSATLPCCAVIGPQDGRHHDRPKDGASNFLECLVLPLDRRRSRHQDSSSYSDRLGAIHHSGVAPALAFGDFWLCPVSRLQKV